MAAPITNIKKQQVSEEQIAEQKINDLKELLTENDEALQQIFSIVSDLNDIGVLDAVNKMLAAKEEIAHIALGQISRKPVTNVINQLLAVAGLLSAIDPENTKKLMGSLNTGLDDANNALASDEKVTIFSLMKVIKDPDVNRALNFGIHFLKGLGKGLKEER
ncbi:DUF1641 domain-containing protein [Rummeliibacillus sp. POC4]|uniref:DUF1641 domain-containing protein n=1 Tax=Rummeliibacillus sp. POC4 TaxID=2305899 RepID=UPI000E663F90|nr:DUF1641 domain-containing protein [Rummeliibacillus sp. POC4]RIJ67073.1 DUF1641 domain-containing protein [Rummeliibacillus sp. POC4]